MIGFICVLLCLLPSMSTADCGQNQFNNSGTCSELKNCTTGQYVSSDPTPVSDRDCTTCPTGWTNSVNADSCTAWSNCTAGEFVSVAGTASSDRNCTSCTSGWTNATNAAACTQWTDCQPGFKVQQDGTATSDRTCESCNTVPPPDFLEFFSNTTNQEECYPTQTCDAGLRRTAKATPTTDRVCVVCSPETFSVGPGSCIDTTTCKYNENEVTSPTTSSDRVCEVNACINHPCGQGADCVDKPGNGDMASSRTCLLAVSHSMELHNLTCSSFQNGFAAFTNAVSEELSSVETDITEVECRFESFNCSLGTYLVEDVDYRTDEVINRTCEQWTTCVPGQYISTAGDSWQDQNCSACSSGAYTDEDNADDCKSPSTCPAGTFVAEDMTTSSDRVCQNCSDSFTTSADQSTCTPFAVCPPGTRIDEAGTATSQRTCVACESGFTTANNSGTCQSHQTCSPSQYVTQAPTSSTDRECDACDAGEFTNADNQQECTPFATCTAGQYIEINGTSTSDRSCQACPADSYADDQNEVMCTPWTDCQAGEQIKTDGTSTSNRVCESCPSDTFSATTNVATCTSHTLCPAGQEESTPPTITSQRSCVNCTLGVTFSNTAGSPCVNVSEACGETETQTSAPTTSADRVCEANRRRRNTDTCPTSCPAGQYISDTNVTNNVTCLVCSPCDDGTFSDSVNATTCSNYTECGPGSEQDELPSASSDRTCKVCTAGFFSTDGSACAECPDGSFASSSNASSCASFTVCGAGFGEGAPPSSSTDRTCRGCVPGEYSDDGMCKSCTSGTNFSSTANATSCTPVSTCSPGFEEKDAPTSSTDRTCRGCQPGFASTDGQSCVECTGTTYADQANATQCQEQSKCGSGTEQEAPVTSSSDRTCRNCRLNETYSNGNGGCKVVRSCPAGEEEDAAPTLSADRICKPCVGQFSSPPEVRVCTDYKVCSSSEYESMPPTLTTDRTCRALSPCDDKHYRLLVPATPTSDRLCISALKQAVFVDFDVQTDAGRVETSRQQLRDAVGIDGRGSLYAKLIQAAPLVYKDTTLYLLDPEPAFTDVPDPSHSFLYYDLTVTPISLNDYQRKRLPLRQALQTRLNDSISEVADIISFSSEQNGEGVDAVLRLQVPDENIAAVEGRMDATTEAIIREVYMQTTVTLAKKSVTPYINCTTCNAALQDAHVLYDAPNCPGQCAPCSVCDYDSEYMSAICNGTQDTICLPRPDVPTLAIQPELSSTGVLGSVMNSVFTSSIITTVADLSVSARVGPMTSSASSTFAAKPATSVQAHVLTSTIFSFSPVLRVALQVSDEDLNTATEPTSVLVSAAVDGQQDINGSCTTDGMSGMCVVEVVVPSSWFSASADTPLTTAFGLAGALRLSPAGTVLKPSSQVSEDANRGVILMLPPVVSAGSVIRGRLFGKFARSAFSFRATVRVAGGDFNGVTAAAASDNSAWSVSASMLDSETVVIQGFALGAQDEVLTSAVELADIQFRVSAKASNITVSGTLDSARSVRGLASMFAPGKPLQLSVDGEDKQPSVGGARDTVGVLLVMPRGQGRLFNMHAVTGQQLTVEASLIVLYDDGTVAADAGSPTCSSTSTTPPISEVSCSSIELPADFKGALTISTTSGSATGSRTVQVWAAQTPVVSAGMSTLYPLQNVGCDAGKYAFTWSKLACTTSFTDGTTTFDGVDVTALTTFSSSNADVAVVDGMYVYGVGVGTASVSTSGTAQALDMNVTNTSTFAIAGISALMAKGVSVTVQETFSLTSELTATAAVDQTGVDRAGDMLYPESRLAAFDITDPSEFMWLDDITPRFTLSATGAMSVPQEGTGFVADGSGTADLTVSWSACSDGTQFAQTTQLDVDVPTITGIFFNYTQPILPSVEARRLDLDPVFQLFAYATYSDGSQKRLTEGVSLSGLGEGNSTKTDQGFDVELNLKGDYNIMIDYLDRSLRQTVPVHGISLAVSFLYFPSRRAVQEDDVLQVGQVLMLDLAASSDDTVVASPISPDLYTWQALQQDIDLALPQGLAVDDYPLIVLNTSGEIEIRARSASTFTSKFVNVAGSTLSVTSVSQLVLIDDSDVVVSNPVTSTDMSLRVDGDLSLSDNTIIRIQDLFDSQGQLIYSTFNVSFASSSSNLTAVSASGELSVLAKTSPSGVSISFTVGAVTRSITVITDIAGGANSIDTDATVAPTVNETFEIPLQVTSLQPLGAVEMQLTVTPPTAARVTGVRLGSGIAGISRYGALSSGVYGISILLLKPIAANVETMFANVLVEAGSAQANDVRIELRIVEMTDATTYEPIVSNEAAGGATVTFNVQGSRRRAVAPSVRQRRDVTASGLVGSANADWDFNGDGQVSIGDVLRLLNFVSGADTAPGSVTSMDADLSSAVDINDPVFIMDVLIGTRRRVHRVRLMTVDHVSSDCQLRLFSQVSGVSASASDVMAHSQIYLGFANINAQIKQQLENDFTTVDVMSSDTLAFTLVPAVNTIAVTNGSASVVQYALANADSTLTSSEPLGVLFWQVVTSTANTALGDYLHSGVLNTSNSYEMTATTLDGLSVQPFFPEGVSPLFSVAPMVLTSATCLAERAPQDFNFTTYALSTSPKRMTLTWTAPQVVALPINAYLIHRTCNVTQESDFICPDADDVTRVASTATTYEFSDMRPYLRYEMTLQLEVTDMDEDTNPSTRFGYPQRPGIEADKLELQIPIAAPDDPVSDLAVSSDTSASIVVTWTDIPDTARNGPLRYVVKVMRNTSGPHHDPSLNDTQVYDGEVSPFNLEGLESNVRYHVSVFGRNELGGQFLDGPIVEKDVVVQAAPPDTAPIINSSSSTDTSVTLCWDEPPSHTHNSDDIFYFVQYIQKSVTTLSDSTSVSATNFDIGQLSFLNPIFTERISASSATVCHTITGLSPSVDYELRVEVLGEDDQQPGVLDANVTSDVTTVRTLEAAPSGAPLQDGDPSTTANSVTVTWTRPAEDKRNGVITGFHLTIALKDAADPRVQDTSATWCNPSCEVNLTGTETTYTYSDLEEYVEYVIEIAAETAVGRSTELLSIDVRTDAAAPTGAVRNINLTPTVDGFDMTWLPPINYLQNGPVTSYDVSVAAVTSDSAFSFRVDGRALPPLAPTTTAATALTNTQFSDLITGLQSYMRYNISIKAVVDGGLDGPVASANDITLEAAPTAATQGSILEELGTDEYERIIRLTINLPNATKRNGVITKFTASCTGVYLLAPGTSTTSYSRETNIPTASRGQESYIGTIEFPGLHPNAEYTFSIQAHTSEGASPTEEHTLATATFRPTKNVTAVLHAVAAVGDPPRITVRWSLPPLDGRNGAVTFYNVTLFRISSNTYADPDATAVISNRVPSTLAVQQSYVFANLEAYVSYSYSIFAINSDGDGPVLTSTSVRTNEMPPEAAAVASVDGTATTMTVQWTFPAFFLRNGPLTSVVARYDSVERTYLANNGANGVVEQTQTSYDNTRTLPPSSSAVTFENLDYYTQLVFVLTIFNKAGSIETTPFSQRTKAIAPETPHYVERQALPDTYSPRTSVALKWPALSNKNGAVRLVEVIVEPETDSRYKVSSASCTSPASCTFYGFSDTRRPETQGWIAVRQRFTGEDTVANALKTESSMVIVGTGLISEGIENVFLTPGASYTFRLKVCTDEEGLLCTLGTLDTRLPDPENPFVGAVASTEPTPKAEESSSTGTIVAVVIVLLLLLVVAVLAYRKRDNIKDWYQTKFGSDNDGNTMEMSHVATSNSYFGAPSSTTSTSTVLTPAELQATIPRRSVGGPPVAARQATTAVGGLQLPPVERHEIAVSDLNSTIQQMSANSDFAFSEEYECVEQGNEFSRITALAEHNRLKNRYANILSYDHSRVKLSILPNDPNSDYINANYIDGFNVPRYYIAAQGPLPHTVIDFWRMIWEQKVSVIVMVTNLEEKGRIKCHRYWPAVVNDQLPLTTNMSIFLNKQDEYPDFLIRELTVTVNQQSRTIFHYHYISWPDHGVPDSTAGTLTMLRKAKAERNKPSSGPMLIHCSAGVGRTGTLMVVDYCMDQAARENKIDVLGCLNSMRRQRSTMVQTESQYVFIYRALADALGNAVTEMSPPTLRKHVANLRTAVPSGGTQLDQEFRRLSQGPPPIARTDTAQQLANKTKNRFQNILPYDATRVKLSTLPGIVGSDYINASWIDGLKQRHAFIATQGPLDSTVADFWRMVWEQDVNSIVMLTLCEENSRAKSEQYWPDPDEPPFVAGDHQVSLENSVDLGYGFERTFSLTNLVTDEVREVRHWQLVDWPSTGELPSGRNVVDLIDRVDTYCRSKVVIPEEESIYGNREAINEQAVLLQLKPIVVHCSAGVGKTGAFCAAVICIRRMKDDSKVDLYQVTKHLRTQRPGMIQTADQYAFVYRIVVDYLDMQIGSGAVTMPSLYATATDTAFAEIPSLESRPLTLAREVDVTPSRPPRTGDEEADYGFDV